MLSTKCCKKTDRDNPLPEYPRPQFVRDSYFSLNGKWRFEISKSEKIPAKIMGDIVVPFSPETELSGVCRKILPDEFMYYEKSFVLPHGFNKGRVFINFGAVDQIADVYLNEKFVGSHTGGYTAFKFEITDYLNGEDKLNSLIVRVRDYSDTKFYSRGKQKLKSGGIWYTSQSGIWQSVWLESTPVKYLERVKITPDFDRACVNFEYFGSDGVDENVEVSVYDGDKLIAKTKEHTVYLDCFKQWSPETPFLYNVEFNAFGETIKSYFGMRKFSVGKDDKGVWRLFLNDKPYFHNGLLDQGYYPDGLLTPPSNQAMEQDILFAKSAGFNMLRKHIKIEPLLWYHYCDVHGIIVWQDMVNGGEKYGLETSVIPFVGIKLNDTNYKNFNRENEEGRSLYYQELEETVNQLYNCPCIAVWVPFNEGWGQFDSQKVYRKLQLMDVSRIIDTTSGWHDMGSTDVISKHIYFTPIKVKSGDKPYVLSEFGGLGLRIKDHTYSDKMFGYKIFKSKETLTKAYEKLYKNVIIPQIKDGLSATVYTQLTDVEDELNGLMTYDREVVKIDIDKLKKINERVRL